MTNDYRAAIAEAIEVTRKHGYELTAWMITLNRGTKNDPEKLRRAAAILGGLTGSATTSSPPFQRCNNS